MNSRKKNRALASLLGSVALLGAGNALAGSATWDFSTDPSGGANPLVIGGNGVNPGEWQTAGGNPGGFLALTWPVGSQVSIAAFPNIDPGKVVTAFKFEADLRVGNSSGDRAADGFSVSFARDGDPVLDENNILTGNQGVFAGGIAEGGSTTGIAVSFDTWSGNTLPDGGDIEGLIVRVDNKTVNRTSLPTRHGACDDATSLQTGPRNADYWAQGGDYQDPITWSQLCWQPFIIEHTPDGKLTVTWKGRKILDGFQTAYFPTASQLVLAGRTGGANEHTHFDNIKLTTTAASCAAPPSVPGNLRVTQTGARRAALQWDASTVAGDPGARIGYEIERDGTVLVANQTGTSYEATGLDPSKTYSFKVRSKNVCGDGSTFATVSVSTVAEVDNIGFLTAQVYRTSSDGTPFTGASQFDMDIVLADPKYPNSPDNVYYVNGLQFGEPNFGDTYGENHMVRIAGVLTAPKTGQFRFYVRSDDASRFYINTSSANIPDANLTVPVAQENGCCGGFEAPGAGDNGDGTFPTSEPISLTAGQRYGVLFLVKEGGGGDWGQVGMREEGLTSAVQAITGPVLTGGKGDPVGAVVNITQQPANATAVAFKPATFTVAAETASPYGKPAFYQWYKNGQVIPGATTATYTLPVAAVADNGAKFKAVIGVVGKSVESAEATLTVTDSVAPAIAMVSGSDTFTTATVTFDQPVTAPSATTAANYTIQGLTVSAATLVDQFTVRLTTSQQSLPSYVLTVNNVQNLGGKPAVGVTATLNAWSLVAGRIRADQWLGFNGASLADMDTAVFDTKYPNTPDVVRYLNNGFTFGEPNFGDTWGENHLVAMKGVLKPTESASYRFFVRSDDASRLFINRNGPSLPDAKTATAIATEAGCCGAFESPGAGDNGDGTFPTSEPISLTAGQSYGVLFLVKEGGGGDWGQVAWRKEGDSTAASSLQPIKDHIYWYGPPAAATTPTIGIARDGAGVKITYEGTLEAADAVTGPFAPVAGATSPYSATTTGAQKYFRARN